MSEDLIEDEFQLSDDDEEPITAQKVRMLCIYIDLQPNCVFWKFENISNSFCDFKGAGDFAEYMVEWKIRARIVTTTNGNVGLDAWPNRAHGREYIGAG